MAFFQATQIKSPPAALITADGAKDVVPVIGDFVIPAGFASGDIVEMVGLPAGYVPVDLYVANEALGTTMTVDVGLLSGDYGKLLDNLGAARTSSNEFMTAVALAATGVSRANRFQGATIAPTLGDLSTTPFANGDRGVAVKFTTVATPTVGAKLRLCMTYRPRIEGA